jgi:5-methylthioadenosine/S-adenosylhomocysteine deaminase
MNATHETDILVKDPMILTMNKDQEVIEKGAILISGDTITKVLATDEVPDDHSSKKVIQAEGMVAIPGLINAHSHLAMTLFRGLAEDLPLKRWLNKVWEYELSILDEEAVRIGFQLALAEMIRGGVTTAHDMYWHFDATMALAEEHAFRLISGPPLTDLGDIDAASMVEQARVTLDGTGAFNFVHPVIQAHSVYTTSPDLMYEAKRLKEEYKVPFTTHASETAAEVQTAIEQFGKTPIEVLHSYDLLDDRSVLAHCVHINDEEIDILAQTQCNVVHCPESNLKLGSGIARVAEFIAAGINVCVGTDGAASNNDLDMFTELRTAALLQKGSMQNPEVLTTYELLEAGTTCGAMAYGLDEQIGSLDAGKKADIVLVDLRKPHLTPQHDIFASLIYSVNKADVALVMIGGQIHFEDGVLTLIDEEKILAEAKAMGQKFK